MSEMGRLRRDAPALKRIAADLHVHTALSACASDDMTPPAIVEAAIMNGLDMIAICDHNSADNAQAVQEAAQDVISVLAGMEITTSEEAHVLGIFPSAESAQAASDEVQATIPTAAKRIKVFGRQLVLSREGEVVRNETRMLFMASGLALSKAVEVIRRHGGLAIASHVDRPSNSVVSQLGMFPTDVSFDAIEISAAGTARGRHQEFAPLGLPMVTSADSHFLSEIGTGRTLFNMHEATFEELAMALHGVGGRGVWALEGAHVA
jgi:predicted metal-dependent phosphoesterase TrpH